MKVLAQHGDGGLRIVGPGTLALYGGTFIVATEAANDVDVTFQLVDTAAVPLKIANIMVVFYVSLNTAGDFAATTALTTLTTVTAAQLIGVVVVGQNIATLTNASGQVVVRGTIAGAATRRLVAVLPDGHCVQSGTMTWT